MKTNRFLNIKNGYNYRDDGGYPIYDGRVTKWHKIVRSGDLSQLSPSEQKYLVDYGIVCDVDLRSKIETIPTQDRVPKGMKFILSPIHGDKNPMDLSHLQTKLSNDPTCCHHMMMHMYRHMMDGHSRNFSRLFQIYLEYGKKGAVLVHCSQGKDRTGVAIAMLLLTLGVNMKTVKQDYMISQKAMVPYIKSQQAQVRSKHHVNDTYLANVKSMFNVSGDYFDSAMDAIKKAYGTWYRFEHQYLHLTDSMITELQNLYLTDPK